MLTARSQGFSNIKWRFNLPSHFTNTHITSYQRLHLPLARDEGVPLRNLTPSFCECSFSYPPFPSIFQICFTFSHFPILIFFFFMFLQSQDGCSEIRCRLEQAPCIPGKMPHPNNNVLSCFNFNQARTSYIT